MLSIQDIFFSFQISITAYVFCCVLTKQNYIFEWYYDLLVEIEQKHKWVAYPLGYCEKCFAGQLALWIGICNGFELFITDTFLQICNLIIFISFTIFFVIPIKHFANKWKK